MLALSTRNSIDQNRCKKTTHQLMDACRPVKVSPQVCKGNMLRYCPRSALAGVQSPCTPHLALSTAAWTKVLAMHTAVAPGIFEVPCNR